ncbi:permease [Reichenbachiella ulvae]|uniref:Permease n=1 Tax=Reichenbachiella ulvae TaxID=2980104 RepID=A0ABT3CTZ4_9BACT|nr:permease [Reichenbachiella ulvae]MCV9387019.1 permease [Reichenbachiella ulvae]
MDLVIQKTMALLSLIIIGLLLQKKVGENVKGIKILILSVALPATIFVALLKIELTFDLLLLPVIALGFNLIMLVMAHFLLPIMGLPQHSPTHRTLLMLLPSLAPGLSCFPFIAEFAGDDVLALAALADVGNKFFVLIFLYALALHWYTKMNASKESNSKRGQFKKLVLTMLNEPINLVIVLAIVLLSLGVTLSSFPVFLENTILRLSSLMMPLILLFIGLAVKIKWKELPLILSLLGWRSGITFCLSAAVIYFMPQLSLPMMLLVIVFPQSAVSFWPFAHMTALDSHQEEESKKTFDINLALSVLACSLPFSTLIVLAVFTFDQVFVSPFYLFGLGVVVLFFSALLFVFKGFAKIKVKLASKGLW